MLIGTNLTNLWRTFPWLHSFVMQHSLGLVLLQMPQRDVLQRALHTSKANPSAAAAAATSGRSAVPLKALHASRINLVSHPLISAHSGGSSQDLLFSPASSVHEAVIPRRVRKHRRSSLGPGRYDEAPMPEEPNQRRYASMLWGGRCSVVTSAKKRKKSRR